jgi:serine/threonine-protein kinase RsbW
MEVAFTLRLPREAASVPVVRRLLRGSFSSLGVEEDCIADLEVAITEACSNVLKHAVNLGPEYQIEVGMSDSSCELRVMDFGAGFDPGVLGEPSLSAEGGRGLHLMRVLVDRLQFTADGNRTVVHLSKRVRLRGDSPLTAPGRLYTVSRN